MALVRDEPADLENFEAFARVFGARHDEPEVERVLAMKAALEAKRAALDSARRSLAGTPFRQASPAYREVGKLLADAGKREAALDCFFLAAGLDPADPAGLSAAAALLTGPRDVFARWRAARGILERSRDDPGALETLVRGYLDAGLRLASAEDLALRLASVRPGAESDRLLAAVRERRKGG
jgi:tetratricopeptide (TPR) repeat protein